MRIASCLLILSCTPAGPPDYDSDGPPTVVSVSAPAEGASRTAPIEVVFSEPIDSKSFDEQSVVVVPGDVSQAFLADLDNPPLSANRADDLVPGTTSLSADGTRATFACARPLDPEARFTLAVSAAVRDVDGHEMGEGFAWPFTTGAIDAGAPEAVLRFPESGATDLPTNLARAIVSFTEPVSGAGDSSLGLDGVRTRVVAADTWCDGCFAIEPIDLLPAQATVAVVVTDGIRDADGEPPFPGEPPSFSTGDGPDLAAPLLGAPAIESADGCLVARWISDEPATSEMSVAAGGAFVPSFDLVHEAGTPVEPGSTAVAIASEDPAGNRTTAGPFPVDVAAGPRVVITELLPNPAGAEPGQEWIEIANFDAAPIDLDGWRIADSSGEDTLPAVTLAPRAVALIVGAAYDPLDGADPPPHPDAILLRLESAIGQSGLRNSGEPARLLDAGGAVVSSYAGRLAAGQGRSIVRVGQCDVAASWTQGDEGASTPGRIPPE